MGLLSSVIVAALVNCFVVQLFVKDRILEAPRSRFHDWLIEKGPDKSTWRSWLYDMTSCQRCFGVWTALPVTWLVLDLAPWNDLRVFAIVMFAASFTQWAFMQLVDTWETKD